MAFCGVFLAPGFALLLGGCVAVYDVEGWDVNNFNKRAEEVLKLKYAQKDYEHWSTAMDDTQQYFRCCAFRDRSWHIWKLSSWHKNEAVTYSKPCVPASCCSQYGVNSTHYLSNCQQNWDGDGAPCAFDDTNLTSSSVAQPALSGDKTYENKAVFYEGCTNHLYWIVGRLGLTIGIFGITDGFAIITMSLIAIMQ